MKKIPPFIPPNSSINYNENPVVASFPRKKSIVQRLSNFFATSKRNSERLPKEDENLSKNESSQENKVKGVTSLKSEELICNQAKRSSKNDFLATSLKSEELIYNQKKIANDIASHSSNDEIKFYDDFRKFPIIEIDSNYPNNVNPSSKSSLQELSRNGNILDKNKRTTSLLKVSRTDFLRIELKNGNAKKERSKNNFNRVASRFKRSYLSNTPKTNDNFDLSDEEFPDFIQNYENPILLSKRRTIIDRNLLYQQIKEVLDYDDMEQYYKVNKLMGAQEEKNEEEEFEKFSEEMILRNCQMDCIYVEKKNPFELLKLYSDGFPLLELRKKILYACRVTTWTTNKLVHHDWFEKFFVIVIIFNCAIMATETSKNKDDHHSLSHTVEIYLLSLYTLEMFMKILGLGLFFDPHSYFRDPWNILDFILVVTAYIPIILVDPSYNLSSLRILRIFHPLKTIAGSKGLKAILGTIFGALPLLMDIFLIFIYFYLIFAIAGSYLFSGKLKNRCFDPFTGIHNPDVFCGYLECPAPDVCGKLLKNPFYDTLNFDDTFHSFLIVFQVVSAQGWTSIMFTISTTTHILGQFYFISIIIIGAFVLLNLTLAVIKKKFTEILIKNVEEEKGKTATKKKPEMIDIANLKLFKTLERTHFRRLKKYKGLFEYDEKIQPYETRMNEFTWEDLFEMSRRIKDEQELEKIKEEFDRERNFELSNHVSIEPNLNKKTFTNSQKIKAKSLGNFLKKKIKTNSNKFDKSANSKLPMIDINVHKMRKTKDNKICPEDVIELNKSLNFIEPEYENSKNNMKNNSISNDRVYKSNFLNTISIKEKMKNQENARSFKKKLVPDSKKEHAFDFDQLLINHNLSENSSFADDPDFFNISESKIKNQDNEQKSKLKIRNETLFSEDENKIKTKINNTSLLISEIPNDEEKIKFSDKIELINEKKNSFNAEDNNKKIPRSILKNKKTDYFLEKSKTLKSSQRTIRKNKKKIKIGNIIHYKMMVDSSKDFISSSQNDVLEKIAKDPKLQVIQKFKSQNNSSSSKCRLLFKPQPEIKDLEIISFLKRKRLRPKTMKSLPLLKDTIFVDFLNHRNKINLFLSLNSRNKSFNASMSPHYKKQSFFGQNEKGKHNKEKKREREKEREKMPEFKFEELIDIINKEDKEEIRSNGDEDLEKSYWDILLKDFENKVKEKKIWSGQNVLPFHIIEGIWTRVHINRILSVLSSEKQDGLVWLNGFKGKALLFDKTLKKVIDSAQTYYFIIFCILGNTFVLCLEGLVDRDKDEILNACNVMFSIIFLVELILKIKAYGLKNYLKDKFNIFDNIIVLLSSIEIILLFHNTSQVTLKLFRTFRVCRVARFLRSLKFVQYILRVIKRSVMHLVHILILLLIFLFIFTLLGINLFGGEFPENEIYRENFDDYNLGFVTTFQILTAIMFNRVFHLYGMAGKMLVIPAFYVVSWVFIGNYIFLNLFLAILLEEFNQETKTPEIEDEDVLFEEKYIRNKIEEAKKVGTRGTKVFIENEDISKNEEKSGEKAKYTDIVCEESLFFFNKENLCRKFCHWLTTHKNFENFFFIIIFLNSVKLIADTYEITYNTELSDFLYIADWILNTFFLIEAMSKIIAFGFFFDSGSYLREYWNILDFVIVICAFIDVAIVWLNLPFLELFKLLRILRPLRLISHNINMKIVVIALLDSIKELVNVFMFIICLWLMFALVGMSLLKDRAGHCQGIEEYYQINYTKCLEEGGHWKIKEANFDNIFNSMLTLLILSSRELWVDIMSFYVDSNESHIGPVKDNYPSIRYYFVIFIFVGSYFSISLLVGTMFYNFSKSQINEKSKNFLFLTPKQLKWLNIQRMIAQAIPDIISIQKPKNSFLKALHKILFHKNFEAFIISLIFVNTILLALHREEATDLENRTITILQMIILIIFIIENITNILVIDFKHFWFSGWNRLGFIINIIGILQYILYFSNFIDISDTYYRFLKIFEVIRLVRTINLFKKSKKILQILFLALPSLINVSVILVLIFFVYAILGVFLFEQIKQGETLSYYVNFQDFGSAMITLFKVASSDDWYLVMFDVARREKGCEIEGTCGSVWAYPFFLSFFVITAYIMINLFILIIIQQFEEFNAEENDPIETFNRNLELFRKIWTFYGKISNSNGYYIHEKYLIDFYIKLEPPLGFGSTSERAKVALEIMKMKLEGDKDGNIYFNDLLFASIKRVFGDEATMGVSGKLNALLLKEEKKVRNRINRKKKRINPIVSHILGTTQQDIDHKELNPIMTLLFLGMAFKTWRSFSSKKLNAGLNSDDSFPSETEESPPVAETNKPFYILKPITPTDSLKEKSSDKIIVNKNKSIIAVPPASSKIFPARKNAEKTQKRTKTIELTSKKSLFTSKILGKLSLNIKPVISSFSSNSSSNSNSSEKIENDSSLNSDYSDSSTSKIGSDGYSSSSHSEGMDEVPNLGNLPNRKERRRELNSDSREMIQKLIWKKKSTAKNGSVGGGGLSLFSSLANEHSSIRIRMSKLAKEKEG